MSFILQDRSSANSGRMTTQSGQITQQQHYFTHQYIQGSSKDDFEYHLKYYLGTPETYFADSGEVWLEKRCVGSD